MSRNFAVGVNMGATNVMVVGNDKVAFLLGF